MAFQLQCLAKVIYCSTIRVLKQSNVSRAENKWEKSIKAQQGYTIVVS